MQGSVGRERPFSLATFHHDIDGTSRLLAMSETKVPGVYGKGWRLLRHLAGLPREGHSKTELPVWLDQILLQIDYQQSSTKIKMDSAMLGS